MHNIICQLNCRVFYWHYVERSFIAIKWYMYRHQFVASTDCVVPMICENNSYYVDQIIWECRRLFGNSRSILWNVIMKVVVVLWMIFIGVWGREGEWRGTYGSPSPEHNCANFTARKRLFGQMSCLDCLYQWKISVQTPSTLCEMFCDSLMKVWV